MDKERIISSIEEQCGSDFVFGKVAAYRYLNQRETTLTEWIQKISEDENLPGLDRVVSALFATYGTAIDTVFD